MFLSRKIKRIQCINCGTLGHTAKKCNEPVTSYGIICYRNNAEHQAEYLMIQKRDSLCYVEFLRGKYDLANRDYLLRLFSNMTNGEKQRIIASTFDTMWQELWADDIPHSRKFYANFLDSKNKFESLRKGYLLKEEDGITLTPFGLQVLVTTSSSLHEQSEWEFPKGRRQLAESDMGCALREFEEETGISRTRVRINLNIKPLEEIFTGMNRTRYRHIYYIGSVDGSTNYELNPQNNTEVRDIMWCDIEGVMNRTRIMYVERKELFMRAHRLLCKEKSNV